MNTGLIKNTLGESVIGSFQAGALVAFLLLFLAILIWTCWPGSKNYYERIANDLLKGE